jgi:hypothetical protein
LQASIKRSLDDWAKERQIKLASLMSVLETSEKRR